MSATDETPRPAVEPDRHCLACDSEEVHALLVVAMEGAPPGTPEHDFAYEHDVVVGCGSCGAVRLETWRHDCFDFESSFDRHWYFPLPAAAAERLREARERCPEPGDPACGCPVHRALRASLEDLPPRNLRADRDEGVRRGADVVPGPGGPRFRWAGS